jgi:heme-degrading monooxygenase HmoA
VVMTILEAQVTPEKWAALEQAYQEGTRNMDLDPGLVQTFLVHGVKEPNQWRILTVWESREALDKMRQSGETPRGVLMFRVAGAEPSLTVFDIVAQRAT